jgi:pimeloyl-[acyl-carrier protein] methyl ester esterase
MSPDTLFLLPGLDGTGVMFRPLVKELEGVVRTVVISYPTQEALDYDELLELVLAALPKEEPFYLLGESFSGPLAIRAAATKPAGLRGVILCASFARNPLWWAPAWLAPFVRSPLFRLYPPLKALKALLGTRANPQLQELTREALEHFHPRTLAKRAREVLRVDARISVSECAVPILYLAGESDALVREDSAREVAALAPEFELVKLPCSHLVLQCEPRAASKAIRQFVTGTS